MKAQFPDDAVGVAVVVLLYSILCALCSCLMIWLVGAHHERGSYVALLAYFTLLSTVASIVQQIHTIVSYRDIKIAQYEHSNAHRQDAMVVITGQTVGLDLVLFYIQYYSYHVEALLSMFWAITLARAVFDVQGLQTPRRDRNIRSWIAKGSAILVPAILLSLLQAPTVRRSPVAVILLADVSILLSLPLGCICLVMILWKYIQTRRLTSARRVSYEQSAGFRSSLFGIPNKLNRWHTGSSMYDRWLLVRFAIVFVVMSGFELYLVFFQLCHMQLASQGTLDLSSERAQTSLLLFVMFGTSRPCLATMYRTLTPNGFRRTASGGGSSLLPVYPGQHGPTAHNFPMSSLCEGSQESDCGLEADVECPLSEPAPIAQKERAESWA
ncbi:hypothetical protein F4780DRAFT_771838 [Xylariomycetidae sp. FL0641]|nr:hypothetical protein F4780DRAFT_771838 [Xylariomycetidae sp. FL0641]